MGLWIYIIFNSIIPAKSITRFRFAEKLFYMIQNSTIFCFYDAKVMLFEWHLLIEYLISIYNLPLFARKYVSSIVTPRIKVYSQWEKPVDIDGLHTTLQSNSTMRRHRNWITTPGLSHFLQWVMLYSIKQTNIFSVTADLDVF